MADYGELAELGFEVVDKGVDKYHDKVYDHLPAWKKKQQKQDRRRSQEQEQQQQQQQRNQAPLANKHHRSRDIEAGEPYEEDYENNRGMSSYGQSQAPSYAPNGRQDYRDYRDDRDDRYVRNEGATSAYYRDANAGAIVMRDNEAYQGEPGYGGVPNAPPPPPPLPYGYGQGYEDTRDRGRPAPSRMRSNSWSPPRNQRDEDEKPRRRRHSRSRSSSREIMDNKQRLAATLIGGLVGGFAGSKAGKGKKYDTVATVAGAVLGGIASREISEKIGERKEGRKEKRRGEQGAWEQKRIGDGGREDNYSRGRDDSRRRERDSGDYSRECERCGRERSRCRCR